MKRFEHAWQDFTWIDIEDPKKEDLVNLAQEFEIPMQALATCMDPDHLPRVEYLDHSTYIILRHFDDRARPGAGSIQELSTKLVFFVGKKYVLTLHRTPLPCIDDKKDKVKFEQLEMGQLIGRLFVKVLQSFETPLDELINKMDTIEGRIYALRRKNILREGYHLKRRASGFKKIFKFTDSVLTNLQQHSKFPALNYDYVRDPLARLLFDTDNTVEEITGLINLHLALMSQKTNEASFKTNEIMRILTVVSIFFLPLNFIAGVYGMNFEFMPELKHHYGYFSVLGTMALLAIAILGWVWHKGWLSKDDF
ncbi:CorA family divalent cation transporter [Bdellovibrio sp. HCB209]|uniref:CorA family divalent cation transporter n=1 Tax=Bdellovibrio sp. HCB209 TaxID=3394354 RepID=UPI0039B3BF52